MIPSSNLCCTKLKNLSKSYRERVYLSKCKSDGQMQILIPKKALPPASCLLAFSCRMFLRYQFVKETAMWADKEK